MDLSTMVVDAVVRHGSHYVDLAIVTADPHWYDPLHCWGDESPNCDGPYYDVLIDAFVDTNEIDPELVMGDEGPVS